MIPHVASTQASTSATQLPQIHINVGPFDANDLEVTSPTFDEFLDHAKVDYFMRNKIQTLGFRTWRAFEIVEGIMSSEILREEGLDLGTRSGLLATAKTFRASYHSKARDA